MSGKARVNTIDGLRGFSLLGILLANLLIFGYGLWGKDQIHLFDISKVDEWAYAFIKIAVEGSFLPIFTFLFGYSMIMMKNSLERKELKTKRRFFRRSVLLIVLGILHSVFLWEGDILFIYGIMGIFLLFFLHRKPKTILIWTLILFALLGTASVSSMMIEEVEDGFNFEPYVEETTEVYSTGTYEEIKEYRNNSEDPLIEKMGEGKLAVVFLLLPFMHGPMFLLGMYAAHRKVFFQPEKESKLYWVGMIVGLLLGIGLESYSYFFSVEGPEMVGGVLLALGYISAFGILYSKYNELRMLRMLENMGKLSLTNYIMQTVICTTIFYGYGLGLFGELGVFPMILLGFMIFGVQMVYSSIYLRYFRYGPLEKVMRAWTYLSFFRNRKNRMQKKKEEQAG